ncbi:MAG: LacI family DNA-binding transcriptional regulator [Clostridiales bacterium]
MATIKDISKIVGVSPSTISRVLNYDDTIKVSYETRKKIFEAAENINYKTISERKNKKEVYTKKIGIINWYSKQEELNDPYYLSISMGIEKRCCELGIDIVKIFKNYNLKKKEEKEFNGIIALGKFHESEIKKFSQLNDDIVVVDSCPDSNKYNSIVVDFKKAVTEIMDYLFSLGHKSIGYIGGKEFIGNESIEYNDPRENTYKQILLKKNLLNNDYVSTGNFTESDGYKLMKDQLKLKKIPSAYFIASDSMAMGAMRAIYESNLKIPEDISVVGFNDIQYSNYLMPPLTTVKIFTEYMGKLAVEILLNKEMNFYIPLKIVVPTKFIERESCKSIIDD